MEFSKCIWAVIPISYIIAESAFNVMKEMLLTITSHKLALMGVIVFGLFAIITAFRFTRCKFFWTPTAADPATAPMSPIRLLSVYATIALIVGGSLLDCIRDTEHWPWSNYPMYSTLDESSKFSDLRIYGVLQNDPTQEISLATDPRYLQPFDPVRLSDALGAAIGRPGLREALLDFLARYENLRQANRHPGPPLAGLRVYKVYWTLDPLGNTIEKPDRKDLIIEAFPPAARAS